MSKDAYESTLKYIARGDMARLLGWKRHEFLAYERGGDYSEPYKPPTRDTNGA